MNTCKLCKFWNRSGKTTAGECRRYHPEKRDYGYSFEQSRIWVVTSGSDWCGEFTAKGGEG
ncbi:MAG: hypothetical protein EBT13_12775 [Rhodobacteraceae bacterium]|nr:hypothetical protein [Paracoccaceae bacterium]